MRCCIAYFVGISSWHFIVFRMNRGINNGLVLVLMALCITAGIFIGRNWRIVEYRETIRYVQGVAIRDTIAVPLPYRVEIPDMEDVALPMRADTVWRTIPITDTVWLDRIKTITQVVDTARIIADFVAINHYTLQVFDIDTVGVFDVNLSVQYNLLRSFDYSFTPMIREVTRYVGPTFIPFVSISTNTFQTVGIGGGVLFRNIGIEYQFLHNHSLNSSGHQLTLKYRFR